MTFPVETLHSARRRVGQVSPPAAQLTISRLPPVAMKALSDCARLRLCQNASRNQPIAVRPTPKAVERRPHDVVVVDESGLEGRLVARFLEGAKVGGAMPVDWGIVGANHRHEVIGVANHLFDRWGRQRVCSLPVVPLKSVELPLDDGARTGRGQVLRGRDRNPHGHSDRGCCDDRLERAHDDLVLKLPGSSYDHRSEMVSIRLGDLTWLPPINVTFPRIVDGPNLLPPCCTGVTFERQRPGWRENA